jgi:hypothetical protein
MNVVKHAENERLLPLFRHITDPSPTSYHTFNPVRLNEILNKSKAPPIGTTLSDAINYRAKLDSIDDPSLTELRLKIDNINKENEAIRGKRAALPYRKQR